MSRSGAGEPAEMSRSGAGEPATSAQPITADPLLQLDGVTMNFGGVVAVKDLTFGVPEGAIYALIGPNGAGKTTVFNLITGVYAPAAGRISFAGSPLRSRRPHTVTQRGIARTFQNIRLFENMSAEENVLVGADARHRTSALGAIFGVTRHRREERDGRQRAAELLDFVGIPAVGQETAKNLSYGAQRRLEIARALATRPRLLLLDEPAAGMNPAEKASLQILIRRIRDSGVTVLIIEHDMGMVMKISDQIVVLDFGQQIAAGTPAEVQQNPAVIEAYLGAEA